MNSSSDLPVVNLDTEIRHLPQSVLTRLSDLLDHNDSWKDLAAIIPNAESPDKLLLSAHDISMLEENKVRCFKSPTESLIRYWSVFGRNRPRVKDFLELLTSCRLIRVAQYLAVDVLGQDEPDETVVNLPGEMSMSSGDDHRETHSKLTVGSSACKVLHYPYSTLEKATKIFNLESVAAGGCLLGQGAFGTVFLGSLENGNFVAVKKLKSSISQQFSTELDVLSRFEHPNLLPLLGYSMDGPATCLVYEYLSRGSLQQCLSDKDNALDWSSRFSIALGTARGINHLHVHEEKPLVHRDIKSANILLDAHLVPKLGDFGLAHLGSAGTSTTVVMTTTISGTSPYMAPEAFRGDVSAKMDVFSYGIVLLELLTSLSPFDPDREDTDLLSHIQEHCDQDISELLDAKAGLWNTEVTDGLYKISLKCTKDIKRNRPTMAEVVIILEDLGLSVS